MVVWGYLGRWLGRSKVEGDDDTHHPLRSITYSSRSTSTLQLFILLKNVFLRITNVYSTHRMYDKETVHST